MWKTVLQVVLAVVVPLAWGLAADWVFERLRRRRAAGPEGDEGRADDRVI